MSIVNSLLKRREFLVGAVGSTCVLTSNKLGALAIANGAGSSSAAMEVQAASAAAASAAASKYRHLLSPIQIGNVTLKNRMYHTKSQPTGLQGPENFPNEALINHFINVARNGAAIVFPDRYRILPLPYSPGRLLMRAWLSSKSRPPFCKTSATNAGSPGWGWRFFTPSGVSTKG